MDKEMALYRHFARPAPEASTEGWEDQTLERASRKPYSRFVDACRQAGRQVAAWLAPDMRLAAEGYDHPHQRQRERALKRMQKLVWVEEPIIDLHGQGYTVREIARITGKSKNTVQSLVAEIGTETPPIDEGTMDAPVIEQMNDKLEEKIRAEYDNSIAFLDAFRTETPVEAWERLLLNEAA